MGTRLIHAATLLKFRPCSRIQKEMGTSPIEEQFHPLCKYDAPEHAYGELTFCHIEKKDRPNKTGPRAFKGIYAGQCKRVKGNIVVHPIMPKPDRTGWVIMPSVSAKTYRVVSGYFVLTYLPDFKGQPQPPELGSAVLFDFDVGAKAVRRNIEKKTYIQHEGKFKLHILSWKNAKKKWREV